MNPVLSDEAAEFGVTARRAFAAMGGVDFARRAEEQPQRRVEVAEALRPLGLDELDPRSDAESLAAAAALCEAAGRVVLPYPVVAVLLRREGDGLPFAVVSNGRSRVDHGDLFDEWRLATLDGEERTASPVGGPLATRLGPFVADHNSAASPPRRFAPPPERGDPNPTPGHNSAASLDVLFHLTLSAWQVLGTVTRAVELAVEHVTGRIQFGKPLSAFQAVQFQLADAFVAVAGLRELALFTLWRLEVARRDAMADVLALRAHALEVAGSVLRTCQQLHGAAGVCDEYDISVLCRHVQPLLRLPFGLERTVAELADAVDRDGFDALFPHGAATA